MIINHNITALNTYRQLNINSNKQAGSMEKLSSGLRINRAGDDAAGLAISEKMRGQIRGLDQASRNAQDGISMVQTAEGALNETQDIVQRMRELAVQSTNATNTDDDRKALQNEVSQLKDEIDRIGNTTEFNTKKLLNGDLKGASGASVGNNTTLGGVVAKLTAGTSVAATAIDTVAPADGDFAKEVLKIDGADITVNWQNLSDADKSVLKSVTTDPTSRQAATDLVIKTINDAIDASGTNVAHITGWQNAGVVTLQSGSTGTDSKISLSSGNGIYKKVMGVATENAGTTKYNGTTAAAADKFNFEINGVSMQATVGTDIDNTTDMATAASTLKAAINAAIAKANTASGATSAADAGYIADVTVNATKDGRFEVVSQTGPISFQNLPGKTTVDDLGLSDAQTNGGNGGGVTFHIGANKGQTLSFGINDMRSAALGIAGVDISTAAGAENAIKSLDTALKSISSERSKLGAVQNRLEHTINNLNTSSENLTAAESRIRDVDMAKEMMTQSKSGVLAQAAQAMLAQANQQPQQVLQLLRG
ncbi:flagellin [Neobacillus cucumis]|nr:flagellin [Neobacillus cucumis]